MNKLIIEKSVCSTPLTTKGFLITMGLVKQPWRKKGFKQSYEKIPTAVKVIFIKSNFLKLSGSSSSAFKKKIVIIF